MIPKIQGGGGIPLVFGLSPREFSPKHRFTRNLFSDRNPQPDAHRLGVGGRFQISDGRKNRRKSRPRKKRPLSAASRVEKNPALAAVEIAGAKTVEAALLQRD